MKLKILFTEDDPAIREEWEEQLSRKFDVDHAQGMREALYRFCIQAPDVAVLSLNIPASEGVRLLALMNQFQPKCPIIMVASEPELYREAMRPELDTLLKKPLAFNELLGVLQALATKLKLDGLDPAAEPITPAFVMSPRGGGRHYRRKPVVPLLRTQVAS